jgi:Zn-dependent peptidase ImmA (M78 family)
MMSREQLARVALRSALELRRKAGVSRDAPICIYDLAESLGVEVWFVGGASFAGMYPKGYERVFVPSERPPGRRSFTCAHELAHWLFDHGSRVEEMDFDRDDHEVLEELLANTFASYLLMPRHAVADAFERRGVEPAAADPIDIYSVACQLGVGYETLLKQLRWSLNSLSSSRLTDLSAIPPKEIRRAVLGMATSGTLIMAGSAWRTVPIDLEVGDFAVLPYSIRLSGSSAGVVADCLYGTVVEAFRPGLTQAIIDDRDGFAAMIRVSRRQFTGRGAYRHLEDPDEGE